VPLNSGCAPHPLNIIWFVLSGLWMAIADAFAALVMFVLVVTI
jgi:uncharacterized membrane protein YccF (DUF307 family)